MGVRNWVYKCGYYNSMGVDGWMSGASKVAGFIFALVYPSLKAKFSIQCSSLFLR